MAVLTFADLHYRYAGASSAALRGASLTLPEASRVVLLGRNGSGKSTLLLHGNGILRPSQGVVLVDGAPVRYDRQGLTRLRSQIGLVLQHPDDQLFSASVAQDMSFGPLNLGLSEAEARERVAIAAARCAVTELLDQPTHALSGGQKARVALAGVLAMNPRVLLADEVLGGLDPWMQYQAVDIFDQLVTDGMTVVLSSHDLELAHDWADLVAVMASGQIIAADSARAIFANPSLREAIGPTRRWSRH